MTATRRTIVLEGIQRCQKATTKLERLKRHQDPAIQELAEALHLVAYGVQQIGLALTDESREDDLAIQRSK